MKTSVSKPAFRLSLPAQAAISPGAPVSRADTHCEDLTLAGCPKKTKRTSASTLQRPISTKTETVAATSITDLPYELFKECIAPLNLAETARLSRVCKSMQSMVLSQNTVLAAGNLLESVFDYDKLKSPSGHGIDDNVATSAIKKVLHEHILDKKAETVILRRALDVCMAGVLKHNTAFQRIQGNLDDCQIDKESEERLIACTEVMHLLLEVVGYALERKSFKYQRALSVIQAFEAGKIKARASVPEDEWDDVSETLIMDMASRGAVSTLLALIYASSDVYASEVLLEISFDDQVMITDAISMLYGDEPIEGDVTEAQRTCAARIVKMQNVFNPIMAYSVDKETLTYTIPFTEPETLAKRLSPEYAESLSNFLGLFEGQNVDRAYAVWHQLIPNNDHREQCISFGESHYQEIHSSGQSLNLLTDSITDELP